MKRLGSVVRNINVYAMSQQPNATMPGNMRLCGPDTAGEIKRRLTLAGSVAPTVEAARPFEAPCLALAMRDCEVLPLAGALLRFWAFGMAKTHLPGSDLPGADSPSSVALCWFASSRSEEHTSELQSPDHLVCRLLLEKKKKKKIHG